MAGGLHSQKIQMGRESTAGTAVPATFVWRGAGSNLQDNRVVEFVDEQLGVITNTNRTYIPKYEGALSLNATPATFDQLPHLLEMGITTDTPLQDGTGGYIYEYPIGTTSVKTIKSYTIETGDNQQAAEMEYCFAEQIVLSGKGGEAVMMSANLIGRQMITSGISFTGSLVPSTDIKTILAQKGSLAIDAIDGTFGTTAVTSTLLEFTLTYNTGLKAKYTIDNDQLYFDFVYFDKSSFEVTLDVTFEHNASATTELRTNWLAETARKIRLRFDGDVITGSSTYPGYVLIADMFGKWATVDALDSQDGNSIVKGTFKVGYDVVEATPADAINIIVENDLTTLP